MTSLVKSLSPVRLFATPWTVAPRLLCPRDSPGKNTGVGCRALLQGIFPAQGSNPGLSVQVDAVRSEPPGKPRDVPRGRLFPRAGRRQLHLTCPPAPPQDSTEAAAIAEHVVKHTLPLVGHRKAANDAKRYARRPLVVVYYGVDFSFDYRAGEPRAGGRG